MRDQPFQDGEPGFDGARVLAVALASSAPSTTEGLNAPAAATAAARDRLAAWRERVAAPESEVRRAGRRLARVIGRLDRERVRAALSISDPGAAARAFVDECGRFDRDFIWDVPLRDVARAVVAAAVRAVRDETAGAHPTGDISDD